MTSSVSNSDSFALFVSFVVAQWFSRLVVGQKRATESNEFPGPLTHSHYEQDTIHQYEII